MYEKLVRDKIPDIIKENGEFPIFDILSDDDYKKELERKILEECNEVLNSSGTDRIEKLADLLEVMIFLAKLEGNTYEDIERTRILKNEKRGSFVKKYYLKDVKQNER